MLIATGYGYRFLAGADPYSDGVVADPGFEIIHVSLRQAVPWRSGFAAIDVFLTARDRPMSSLCAVELRSPEVRSFEGFAAFNDEYRQVLDDYQLVLDGRNPIARTNVVPTTAPPGQVVLSGFSFTEATAASALTFVTAGAGELLGDELTGSAIVAPGDTTTVGLHTKATHVMATMTSRLRRLGVTWDDATTIDVYMPGPPDQVIDVIQADIGRAKCRGVHWYPSRPPIAGLDFEMDVRGVDHEVTVRLPDA